mgnify:CR=1 FL=1
MSKIKLTGSNSGYVEISSAADAGNLTLALPTAGTTLLSNADNVFSGITTFTGLNITDDVTFNGASYNVVWDKSDNQLEFGDNAKLSFGASSDLQIYHDGNHSIIEDTGTGNLFLRSDSVVSIRGTTIALKNAANTETLLHCVENGAVSLYHDNALKLQTTQTGAVVTGICTATSFSGSGEGLTRTTQYSHRNLIINGAMTVSQRGTGALSVSNSGKNYQVDMFRCRAQGGGVFSIQQVVDAPSGTGLYNSSKLTVTTADTNIATTDYYEFIQYIEGWNFLPTEYGGSGARTCTLSFYVKCNATGVFTGAVGNQNNNRGFAFTYGISQSNTWERKTITIPGDTTGSWERSDGVGLKVIFSLGIGSQFATSNVSTWESRETMGAVAGNYNLMVSTSNYIYFTGIQFELGEQATPFEHRGRQEEITRCQRYYATGRTELCFNGVSGRYGWRTLGQFNMRATPTVTATFGSSGMGSIQGYGARRRSHTDNTQILVQTAAGSGADGNFYYEASAEY